MPIGDGSQSTRAKKRAEDGFSPFKKWGKQHNDKYEVMSKNDEDNSSGSSAIKYEGTRTIFDAICRWKDSV